jgi:Na+/melibiose symporter-like transporter
MTQPRTRTAGLDESDGDGKDGTGRNETEAERLDRQLSELLQELRVISLGVQVLLGFLLSLPFTNRFSVMDTDQKNLYLADVLLAALATALLISPVSYHRLVFRKRKKRALLKFANMMAIAGLVAVVLAVTGSVLLVLSVVFSGLVVPIVAAGTAFVFTILWFVGPPFSRSDDY